MLNLNALTFPPITRRTHPHGRPAVRARAALFMLAGVLWVGVAGEAQAQHTATPLPSCENLYQQALRTLDQNLQKKPSDPAPDVEAFARAFKPQVDQLTQQQCLPELTKLLEHIKQEQAKYPDHPNDNAGDKTAPITPGQQQTPHEPRDIRQKPLASTSEPQQATPAPEAQGEAGSEIDVVEYTPDTPSATATDHPAAESPTP